MSPAAGPSGGLRGRLRGLFGRGAPRGAMPSFVVADLLERGRKAKPAVSALDAVMGKDWALVDFDRAGRPPISKAGIAAAHARDVARSPGGGVGFSAGRDPQAVVKMIRTGGASDVRGLRAQMAYLSRQGEEPLQRSERYMGAEINADQAASLERAWRMPETGPEGGADRTSHFIVSFPEGTEIGAAEQAGRDWAEEMFGSGEHGGDSYDYYTAFHTDRAHPHMHVVVHRRGLENGAWLKVSLRSDITYDWMREVLVGSRASTASISRPPRGTSGGSTTVPSPTRSTGGPRSWAGARGAGAYAPDGAPGRGGADPLRAGRGGGGTGIEADRPGAVRTIAGGGPGARAGAGARTDGLGQFEPPERTGVSAGLTAEREAHMATYREMDGNVMQLEPVSRVEMMRRVANLKMQTRGDSETRKALGPQGRALDPYTRPDPSGRDDGGADGIDAEATLARFSGGEVSEGLARDFARAEADERAASREARGLGEEDAEHTQVVLDRMHREFANVRAHAEAERRAEQERQAEAGRRAEEMRRHEEWRAERRREAERKAKEEAARREVETRDREDAARRAAERGESETDRWIRERLERERNDRDGGRGL